jgi:hypothetical protein
LNINQPFPVCLFCILDAKMKKILGLLSLVIVTAILSSLVTFYVVTSQYHQRHSRDQDAYEQQIGKLEDQVKQLETALRQSPLHVTPAVTSAKAQPAIVPTARPQPTAGITTPALPIATSPSLTAPTTTVPVIAGGYATMLHYEAASTGSKCQINGTSSIHDWDMVTSIIGGFFDTAANLDPSQAAPTGIGEDGRLSANAEATIPVRSLKSYQTAMDEVYQDHMEAAKYRRIEYHLKELILKKPHAPNTPFEFDSTGELAVHGVTNQISMPVKIERQDTALKISGTIGLKMSDYKVEPPSPTIGVAKITTGDAITITFEWLLVPSESRTPVTVPVSTTTGAK